MFNLLLFLSWEFFLILLLLLNYAFLLLLFALLLLFLCLLECLVVQTVFIIIFLFLNQLINAQHSFVQLRLCSWSKEVVKSKHGLHSYLLFDEGHVSQSKFIDILCKEPICINGEEFGPKFGVNCRVELYLIAPWSLPLKQFFMQFSTWNLIFSVLDLLQNSILITQFLNPCPKYSRIFLDLTLAFTYQLGNLLNVLASIFFTSCNEIIEILLRPIAEPSLK